MTIEEQAEVIQTIGTMEALGWQKINEEDKPEGVYATFLLPRKQQTATIETMATEIPAAQ